MKYDRDLLDDCALNASAFSAIKFKTAAFIAQNKIYEASKDNYIAAVRDAVKVVSEHMLSEEVREKMLNSMDKPKTYKAELEKKRADIEAAPKRALLKEMDRLQTKADSLLKTLSSDIPKLTNALRNCNDLFLATGQDRSYLLDNCWGAKAGPRCMEDKKSTHAGCCCAYNPVSQFGKDSNRYAPTIAGTSAIPGATVGSRRLAQSKIDEFVNQVAGKGQPRFSSRRLGACEGSDDVMDICAEAWTEAAPQVQQYYKDATATGKEVMEGARASVKAKYPEYCDPINAKLTAPAPPPADPTPTPSPSPTPTPGGDPSPSPTPTPSPGGSPAPATTAAPSDGGQDTSQAAHVVTPLQLFLALMVISKVW